MAVMAVVKFALLILVIFCIKKPSFLNANSVCYNTYNNQDILLEESFIYSSIWQFKQEQGLFISRKCALKMLLILAGDIELCPGPDAILICPCCSKTIRRNQSRGNCGECDKVVHLKCLVDRFDNGDEQVFCNACIVPNESSSDLEDNSPIDFGRLNSFLGQRGMKLFHQNINGLLSKMDEIRIMLGETSKSIHILGITETHANKSMTDDQLSVDGYILVRKDRKSGHGGGVCCFVRNDLKWQRRTDLEVTGLECLWLELFIQNSKSILINITYRPPDSSEHIDRDFKTKFANMLESSVCENKEVILSGDLNCNYLIADDHKEIKDIISINGFTQLINKPTRITHRSKSLIDIFATTHETRIVDRMVHASPISDHDLIGIIRKINCKKFTPRKIQCRNYKNFNPDRFKQDLRNQPWTDILNISNLNTAWNEFKNLLTAVIEKHAPLQERIVRGNDSPWLTSEIKKKIRDRDYYLRKARKTNSENDWSNFRRCRNMVTTAIRISKARYNRDLLRQNSNNPKNFWKTIKRCYPTKSNGANPNKLFNINGEKISDIKSISEGFCTYFSTVAKTLQQSVVSVIDRVWRDRFDLDLKRLVNPNNNVFNFRQIQPHEVLYSLRTLKISKSVGVDNLPPMLIKQGAEEIAHPLNVLINRSIQESIFPTAEKCAKVIPIYKSGERAVFDNYRPISVLPILSKIIERLVYQQLYEYLENHNLLSQNQFGFRGGRCTAHAVLHLTECIRENMDKGNLTGAVYIDLKKAFDTVDHGCLLSKMSYYGIENNELKWFEDYMFNRMQYVQYDGINSERQNITCGVPQGSILGPLLFIIHINDINIVLQKANLILYADDTVMFYSGKNTEEIQYVLHNELEKLAIWFKQNNLTVNMKIGKTEFVLYGTMKRISQQTPDHQIDLKINGETINESKSYEYLGVTMDSNLSFTKYLHKLYKKGTTRVKLLSTVRINISPYVAETIYKTMVEPVIMYCSTVFLGDQRQCCKKLQNIQERAHKIVFGNKIKNSWIPLQNQRELNGAIDVFKSIHGLCPDVFKNTFTKINHQKATRGNGINLLVPRSKTETGRKMFANQGALLFNKLPGDLKEERSLLLFKSKMRLKHCDF